MNDSKGKVFAWQITLGDDPVVEAYKRDVDRTLLRENLKLTVDERFRRFESFMRGIDELRGAARAKACPVRDAAAYDDTVDQRGSIMTHIMPVVHSDPEILGGVPVFVGTRVPVQTMLDYLAAGDTLDDFLAHFPTVAREQATAALEHAKELLIAHAHTA